MRFLIMADRHGPNGSEAEPVVVDDDGDSVTFEMDDGERIVFDAAELFGRFDGPAACDEDGQRWHAADSGACLRRRVG